MTDDDGDSCDGGAFGFEGVGGGGGKHDGIRLCRIVSNSLAPLSWRLVASRSFVCSCDR